MRFSLRKITSIIPAVMICGVICSGFSHSIFALAATDIGDGSAPVCSVERHLYGYITEADGHTLIAQSEGSAGTVYLYTSRATIRPKQLALRRGLYFRAYGCFGQDMASNLPAFRASYLTLFVAKKDIVYISDSAGEAAEQAAATGAPHASPASASGGSATAACAGYRWSVKIGLDPEAKLISLAPQKTTIASLAGIRLSGLSSDSRSAPAETSIYELDNVYLVRMYTEHDLDYHLIVRSATGKELTLESPDPNCVHGSAFESQISTVRRKLDAEKPSPGSVLSVVGVGFYDSPGSGGMELHPLLSICVGKNCQP